MTPQELTERRAEGLTETSQAATEPDEASPAGSQAEACASTNGKSLVLTAYPWDLSLTLLRRPR
jgi:hypothetical protein